MIDTMTDTALRPPESNPIASVQWHIELRSDIVETPELRDWLSASARRIAAAHLRELNLPGPKPRGKNS